jgi:hypothetical protein
VDESAGLESPWPLAGLRGSNPFPGAHAPEYQSRCVNRSGMFECFLSYVLDALVGQYLMKQAAWYFLDEKKSTIIPQGVFASRSFRPVP